MKVLFLDIDGVLNGHTWDEEAQSNSIDHDCVEYFNSIITACKPKVVLTSAWRYMIHRGAMNLQGFEYLLRTHGVVSEISIIGLTREDRMLPCSYAPAGMMLVDSTDSRGLQISDWLKRNTDTIECYLVLDDMDDGISERHPAIITDGEVGLTEREASKAIAILS